TRRRGEGRIRPSRAATAARRDPRNDRIPASRPPPDACVRRAAPTSARTRARSPATGSAKGRDRPAPRSRRSGWTTRRRYGTAAGRIGSTRWSWCLSQLRVVYDRPLRCTAMLAKTGVAVAQRYASALDADRKAAGVLVVAEDVLEQLRGGVGDPP